MSHNKIMVSNVKNVVVKTNRLIAALQTLTLAETRIIQLCIIDARETGRGLDASKPLRVDAGRYAAAFGVSLDAGYKRMLEAEDGLFKRQFTIADETGKVIKSRWIQDVSYLREQGAIEMTFTRIVVDQISKIDGLEQFFTSYLLEQTANLTSVYAVRLYELLMQWKTASKTPVFELNQFREQLGVGVNEYKLMNDFKKRVLDLAIIQINEHTDITPSYEQHKRGRVITGFSFKFKQKQKPVEPTESPKMDIAALLTDEFVSKHAQIGESWEQARTRLRKEAATGKFSLSLTP
jgi:plasmid replication initiation protein